ncbi:hypothetical protein ACHHYP_08658 [Achlya hypogyna]|uniref:Chromatin assembly factor 1 subunit A dimerization domain-containing protein n=1 Tax=Achlya hypogyna TaxID=1202772 RepID=A0A1V9ZKI7_ACHHY|nr:hypothetical protein ACHHYP_08658 [Achlya hypogyna]
MTTPERKQKSIAAFFSPVGRATEPAPPSPAKPSPAKASPAKAKTPPPKAKTPPPRTATRKRVIPQQVAEVPAEAATEAAEAPVTMAEPTPSLPSQEKPTPEVDADVISEGSAKAPIDVDMESSDDASVPSSKATRKRPKDEVEESTATKKRKGKAAPDADDADKPKETRKRTRPVRQAALAPPKVPEVVEVAAKKSTPRAAKKKPALEPPAPPVVTAPTPVVLSPQQQQKLDMYLAKLTDVEAILRDLMAPSADAVAQEIYGVALDTNLELHAALEADCVAALATTAGAADKVAPPLKAFLARSIQGRTDGLSVLVAGIGAEWRRLAPSHPLNAATVEMEIKVIAERIAYGAKPKKASNLFEDTTPRALYVWEVGNLDASFGSDESVKTIRRMRKQRKRTGLYLKTLDRIVAMLQEAVVDDSKLSVEEAKASKFLVAVEMEKQKASEKELKATLLLEKEEAKRKEKEEAAEKKRLKALTLEKEKEDAEAAKRRQTLVSYFQPTPSKPATTIAPPVVIDVSALDDAAAHRMRTIDQALTGMGSATGAVAALSTAKAKAPAGSWSSSRVRHPTLGLKKLLQFHENYRPAYCGTFSKTTRVLRRGRKPLALVPGLDYSVDSDDEWEEEEVGESLSDHDSDDDGDDGDDALDYGDKWLAYEDEVDYVDRAPDDEATTESRHVKVTDVPKASKLTKLVPRVTGPFWTPTTTELAAFRVQLLAPIELLSPLLKKAEAPPAPAVPPAKLPKATAKSAPKTSPVMKASAAPALTSWLQSDA